jgi:hypothetical protein
MLDKIIASTLQELGLGPEIAWEAVTCIKILVRHQNWYKESLKNRDGTLRILQTWLRDPNVQKYLKVNKFQGTIWFNKESMESLLRWMLTVATISVLVNDEMDGLRVADGTVTKNILSIYEEIRKIQTASKKSEYKIERLLKIVA